MRVSSHAPTVLRDTVAAQRALMCFRAGEEAYHETMDAYNVASDTPPPTCTVAWPDTEEAEELPIVRARRYRRDKRGDLDRALADGFALMHGLEGEA